MSKPKRAVWVIDEATGKRIIRATLGEPYPKSQEVYLTIEFDDETELVIEVECHPCFRITHLAPDPDGDMGPVKESTYGPIRSLAKGLRSRS
jgi:hypothetical protein